MAFLGPDDILVTEKDTGVIRRILNGVMLQKPLLDVNVANYGDRGMLGIAVSNKDTDNILGNDKISIKNYGSAGILTPNNAKVLPIYVFVYYTVAQKKMVKILQRINNPSEMLCTDMNL